MSVRTVDENDRAVDGTLPIDPASDTSRIEVPGGLRKAVLNVVGVDGFESLPEPNDVFAEAALLGTLMWCGANAPALVSFSTTRDLVDSGEHFFAKQHGAIIGAIAAVFDSGSPHDIVAVHAMLVKQRRDSIAGGLEYLEELVANAETASPAKARSWAGSIRETYGRRELIKVARDLDTAARARKESIETLALSATEKLDAIAVDGNVDASTVDMKSAMRTVLRVAMGQGGADFHSTGIRDLDRIIGGFYPGETSILASATSLGKSVLAAQIARDMAGREVPLGVLYVTLEMSPEAFARRVAAAHARVPHWKVRQGKLSFTEAQSLGLSAQELAKLPIVFSASLPQTVKSIAATAKAAGDRMAKNGVRLFLVVIDTLGLVKPVQSRNSSRTDDVSQTSRGLRWIATACSAHVLAVHHINREGSKREGKSRLPKIFDLRDSGATENDADNIILLHRDRDEEGLPLADRPAAIVVGKSRNDGVGSFLLNVSSGGYAEFTDCNESVKEHYR